MTGSVPLVLVVEDHNDTRDLYGVLLRAHGYNVMLASSAREALQQADTRTPDLVLTDLGLGGDPSGVELVRRLRERTWTDTLPIIAVTGWVGPDMETRATAAGCDVVLIKPCSPQQLLSEVSRLLTRAR